MDGVLNEPIPLYIFDLCLTDTMDLILYRQDVGDVRCMTLLCVHPIQLLFPAVYTQSVY